MMQKRKENPVKAAIDFISKYVLQYMEQNNLEINDSQAAALICHSWLSVPERHKGLEEFAAETEDKNFRKQITILEVAGGKK